MNERELSLIKALGEEFGAAIKKMADDFQQALEKTASNLEKQLEEVRQSIPVFQPVEIPDVSKMVADAVSEIELPKAPELPDFNQIIADATKSAVKQAFESIPDPESARDGRDALAIEIEPFIDEKKSYPRGTYATHKGGLWRSHEKTHGMRGWECIVDGVSGVDVKQDNQRTFSISLERASGTLEVKSFDIPVTIYRDVFKSGTEYQPGDTVTWGGSMWHCNETTTDKPGEPGSKGWTLAVKKGRDLRDKQ